MKINFGSGDKIKEGYVNCDVRPLPGNAFTCTAWDIIKYVEKNTVDECYSRHFLEHLTLADAILTLKSWRYILKKGGIVDVEVPNMVYHANQLVSADRSKPSPISKATNFEHAMAGFYGWQHEAEKGETWDIHRHGYTFESLHDLMYTHGFKDIKIVNSEPWNLRIRGVK